MDGINGLATGQAILSGLGSALIALAAGAEICSWPVAASLGVAAAGIGFLPHNFPRAKMFLGDVGSASIGFCLASVAFEIFARFGARIGILVVLLHANFILDTSLTLVNRIRVKANFLTPHRDHFYQKLNRSGLSHTQVTGIEMILQVIVFAIVFFTLQLPFVSILLTIVLVMAIWLLFFMMTEVALNRRSSSGIDSIK
jgi:UDP-N-acetylmuramyl pentapeptide phosphotransferase/UDP-N-acetylglucosamine-1-phosphate transferase